MSKRPRHIAVVTGTRADYGLLEPVMRAIDAHRSLKLSVIVTGIHLITQTWRDIVFPIAAKVPMQRRGRVGRLGDVDALSRGVGALGRTLDVLKPDVVLVLGDRIEAFAAACSASVGGFRLAHTHGGDRAEGVADEAMRHAISKLAHLHFTATAQSRRRLLRMGEPPEFVFNTGSPAIDALRDIAPADAGPECIVLQHPIGDDDAIEARRMQDTLQATCDLSRLVLLPNHDPGREGIMRAIRQSRVQAVEHLPRERFVALLKSARLIVGNSSAGLIEAAACKTSCINIGSRQHGREKPGHVIDCDYGQADIRRALQRVSRLNLSRVRHPYGPGQAGARIADLLASLPLALIPLRKHNRY
jgi:UDP-hydrolysing UDP-N-acetyl-D-glucosamine 2-epimerase